MLIEIWRLLYCDGNDQVLKFAISTTYYALMTKYFYRYTKQFLQ